MWYHLQRSKIGQETAIVCLCPEARTNRKQDCLHKRFLEEFGEEKFQFEVEMDRGMSLVVDVVGRRVGLVTLRCLDIDEHVEPILFSRQRCIDDKAFLNHFSVPASQGCSLFNKRVVVRHEGNDSGPISGTWTCSKDPSAINCAHVLRCQHTLQRLINCDWASSASPTFNPSDDLQY